MTVFHQTNYDPKEPDEMIHYEATAMASDGGGSEVLTPTPARSEAADPRIDRLRRLLIALAGVVTLLAAIHHADHVIRGELVLSYGLDADWNHSGWPFQSPITPFTASLLVYLVLVPGLVFTVRGRLWAGYWLAGSLILGAVIVLVHFAPGPKTETPGVIFASYEQSSGSAIAGVLALIDVFAIVAGLLALLVVAVRARLVSGRW